MVVVFAAKMSEGQKWEETAQNVLRVAVKNQAGVVLISSIGSVDCYK